jgi:transposase
MERYIGLDVHAQSCTIAVMGPSGKRLRSLVVETNGAALVEAVQGIAGRRHVCFEEGTQSAWLHELLRPHVVEIVVMVPPKTNGPKDDLRDAWACADAMRTGATGTRVYKAPEHLAALRNAVRAYGFAVRDVVRTKNRLKSVFLSRGIVADSMVYDAERRGKWLKKLPPAHRRLAEWLGRELDELQSLREEADGWLGKEAKTHPIIRTLSTAPGLGPIRCAQLVAVVVTPSRFRTSRQFWSYSGLSIVTRSSANWKPNGAGKMVRVEYQQTLGLSRKRHPLLKAVFKGAATTVIEQMPKHPLHEDYQRMVAAGRKPNLAKLTLSRRIAAIVLSMWKNEEEYDPKRHVGVPAKA